MIRLAGDMKQPVTSLFRFIISLLSPYKKYCSIIACVGLAWALINTFLPYTLKLIIDHVVAYDDSTETSLFKSVMPFILFYILLWTTLNIVMRILDWVKLKLFPSLREDVMVNMFGYISQHSYRYFQNNFAGSLSNKIIDMQSGVVDILTTLDDAYAQSLGLIVAIVMLLFVNPIFSITLIAWLFVFLIATFVFLKPIQVLSSDFAQAKTTVVGKMVDSLGNILNVRLFSRFYDENCYIHHSVKEAVHKDRAMQVMTIKMRIFWDISIVVLLSANLLILLHLYGKGLVTIGDFTFVITLSVNIFWCLWFLASQFVSFSEQVGVCKQALSIISIPHEIIDAPDAKKLKVSQGEINFKDVTFHYQDGAKIFNNKNIVIKPQEKVGLVGFSGSGKSSFVNLILRLFDVESGTISIDEQNIALVTQNSLRESIALIPQDTSLFHRTLLENIKFGNPRATDEEAIDAAKKAHCDEFIQQLSEKYQSLVGERGVKLSGGQRQRIAIARAILKNAPILILDEATSALDSVTERYIQESLDELMQDKTTIVIAHRLSTLSKMDRILVFDNGVIVEDGAHEVLVARNGHYAKMWHMQAGGFLPEENNS